MPATVDIIIANSGPEKILKVPYKLDEPIFFLLKRIHGTLGTDETTIERHDLFLNGRKLKDHNQTMEYYSVFGRTVTYRAISALVGGDREIQVFVKTLTGKTFTVNCRLGMLVDDLKELIRDKEGIPLEQQRLIFRDKQLEDERTLADYGVIAQSTLHVILRLRGGGILPGIIFSDVSDSSGIRKVHFSQNAPRGRTADRGTNVECNCKCTSTHRVICAKKFGILEVSRAIFTCPNCGGSDRITPISVGFMRCKYRFHGIKASGEQYTSDWKEVKADDCYQLFSPDNEVHWRRLVIESSESNRYDDCAICLESLRVTQALNCGHRFHEKCIGLWQGSCPSCRYNRHLITGHDVEE